MAFNPMNPISAPKMTSSPPSPMTGTRGLYPTADGWVDIDDDGTEKKLLDENSIGGITPIVCSDINKAPYKTGWFISSDKSTMVLSYVPESTGNVLESLKGYQIQIKSNGNIKYRYFYTGSVIDTDQKSGVWQDYLFDLQNVVDKDGSEYTLDERDYVDCNLMYDSSNGVGLLCKYSRGSAGGQSFYLRIDKAGISYKSSTANPQDQSSWKYITYTQDEIDAKLDGKVNKTDYATGESAGIIQPSQLYFDISSTGLLRINGYNSQMLEDREHAGLLTPAATNDIVKAALTDKNKLELTEEEKTSARSVIGAIGSQENNNIKNILDSSSIGGLNQKFDGENTFDFTDKNPNAAALDSTLTGNINKGATGQYASSFGGKSAAMGKRAHSEGTTTIAKGNYSHAEGDNSVSLGNDSHAEGYMTVSHGDQSHAEGIRTVSSGASSHAEGIETISTGRYSHSEGIQTKSIGESSHSEGNLTEATGAYSHVEGHKSKTLTSMPDSSGGDSGGGSGGSTDPNWNVDEHLGESSHAEGAENIVVGYASHAEGAANKAYGHYSHAEGILNITGLNTTNDQAIAPHAEGYKTEASGNYSHAEGSETKAQGVASHVEGSKNTASGETSHAEGSNNIVSGVDSHVEGSDNKASHKASHVEGQGNETSSNYQHVQGKYSNKYESSNYAHIVGNGENDTNRSNAYTLDWDGNGWFAGDIKVGGNQASEGSSVELKSNKTTIINDAPNENQYPTVQAVKNYAEPKTEIINITIATDESGNPVPATQILGNNNKEMRYINTVGTLILKFPDGEYDTDYMQGLTFKSGTTPTHISYAATGIIQWIGTDCFISDDNKSIFKPSANTHYDIVFYYNGGNYIVGLVNGYKVATGNQEANA